MACGFANDAGEQFCGGCGKPAADRAWRRRRPTARAGAADAGAERRQVAVLFADLCGFTALSRRLDAEDLRRLVESFYARTDAIVATYGGTVDKHIGDAVMALFGAPVAHGDDGLRALRAALDIAATTGEIAGPEGEPLAAHVGIAMGEVVAGGIGRGYTVLGDAVNLASRLVHLAGPGEVVMAEDLKRMLEGQVRAVALPPVRLKGFAEPVTGWRGEGLETEGSAGQPLCRARDGPSPARGPARGLRQRRAAGGSSCCAGKPASARAAWSMRRSPRRRKPASRPTRRSFWISVPPRVSTRWAC